MQEARGSSPLSSHFPGQKPVASFKVIFERLQPSNLPEAHSSLSGRNRQVGPVRHTITHPSGDPRPAAGGSPTGPPELDLPPGGADSRPAPVLHVHPTSFSYTGDADPSAPGGIAAIYQDLVADQARTEQVTDDVTEALRRAVTAWSSPNGSPTSNSSPTHSASVARTR